MIVCSACREAKDPECFAINRARPNGRQHNCKPCAKIYRTKYHAKNRDAVLKKLKENYLARQEYEGWTEEEMDAEIKRACIYLKNKARERGLIE
jgi:hypothetical protein